MDEEIVEVSITRKTEDGKLVRERLSGEEAKRWEKWVHGVESFGHVHNYKLQKPFDWETETISDWL